jgi:hypothetical protein
MQESRQENLRKSQQSRQVRFVAQALHLLLWEDPAQRSLAGLRLLSIVEKHQRDFVGRMMSYFCDVALLGVRRWLVALLATHVVIVATRKYTVSWSFHSSSKPPKAQRRLETINCFRAFYRQGRILTTIMEHRWVASRGSSIVQ